MSKRGTVLRIVGYTLYACGVFLIVLYMTFPYDLLRQRLTEQFSQGEVRFAVAQLRPGFPPGVLLHRLQLRLQRREATDEVVQVDTLRLTPSWLALLSSRLLIRFEGTLYAGRVVGEARSSLANGADTWEVEARFADLDIAQHPFLQQRSMVTVRGRLHGEAAVMLSQEGKIEQGDLTFRLQPAAFKSGEGLVLPLQREVTCDTLQGEIKVTAQQLRLVSCVCEGDDLAINARGTVRWRQPLLTSSIDLRLQVRSETAYKQEVNLLSALVHRRLDRRGELSFSVRGTLQQPRFGA